MSGTQLTGEAVARVAELAVAGKRRALLNVPGENPAMFPPGGPGGDLQSHEKSPMPRKHRATRLVDVRQFVTDHLADFPVDGAGDPRSRITVWCWRGSVTSVLDDEDYRADTITLSAPDSAAFATLTRLSWSEEWLDQAAFLRLLKVDLFGCVPSDFITLMRQLKFSQATGGEGDVQAGRESLGVSIQREALAGGRAMPEDLVVTVPVYQDLIDGEDDWDVYTAKVVCALSVDYTNRRLRLEPIPDELTAAKRQADEWVFSKMRELASDKVRVYCGSPNPS